MLRENIRGMAVSIHPGPIETDMLAEKLSNIESRSASESKIPMGRIRNYKGSSNGNTFSCI